MSENGTYNAEAVKEPVPDKPNLHDLLSAELERMEQRNINGEPRNDSKFTILRSFVEQMQEGEKFENIWEQLADYEKFAILTRLENASNSTGMENPHQQTEFWNTTIKPLRKELGISIEFEEDGNIDEKTDFERLNELEQLLQDINKERGHNK